MQPTGLPPPSPAPLKMLISTSVGGNPNGTTKITQEDLLLEFLTSKIQEGKLVMEFLPLLRRGATGALVRRRNLIRLCCVSCHLCVRAHRRNGEVRVGASITAQPSAGRKHSHV